MVKARKEQERANELKSGKQLVAEDLAAKGVDRLVYSLMNPNPTIHLPTTQRQ